MNVRVADPLIGQVVDGRYAVRSRIARGGMATVYLAVDERLDRNVALKVMHANLADDDEFLHRFIREARSAARLTHPGVVHVYDQGQHDGIAYLAMEYVPGRTLRDLMVERETLSPREALDILEPVLDALGAAHAAGLVHRDIKPENVLLADDGRLKVADFGLARAVNSATTSQTGLLLGTVAYLAPEQVERGLADARSDVYAAGVLLFEMLTGVKPFEGQTAVQVAFQHVTSEVPAPSSRAAGVPRAMDELVAEAAARDPSARPSDARELLMLVRETRHRMSAVDLDRRAEPPARSGRGTPDVDRPYQRTMALDPHEPVTAAPSARRGRRPRAAATTPHAAPSTKAPGSSTDGNPEIPAPQQRLGAAAPGAGANPGAPPDEQKALSTSSAERAAGTDGRAREREGADALTDSRPPEDPQSRRPQATPGRSRARWAVVTVLLLAALLGVGGWYLGAGPGAYTTVPRLSGLPQAQAEQALRSRGLDEQVTTAFDEAVPRGRVVRADPSDGTRLRKDGTVTLVVSKGQERYSVPRLTGRSEAAARTALERARLAVGDVRRTYDEDAPKGEVLSASADPGSRVRRGTQVDLVVSRGPRPIPIASYVGKSGDRARAALSEAGFDVRLSRQFSDTVAEGTVVSQSPSSGTGTRGSTVRLVVSKGPRLVTVPGVVGQQVEAATRALRGQGFQVSVRKVLGGFFGSVRAQDPAAGQRVPAGSTITLTVV